MDAQDRRLLDRLQVSLPLESRPFAAIGEELGLSEEEVLARIGALRERGLIRRIGPVLDPGKVGRLGCLAAMRVPPERIEEVAATVSACERVTHNYERKPIHGECPYNLWFTMTAGSQGELDAAIGSIAEATDLPVATLPVGRKFKIGVRFALTEESDDG